jgi:hypothetical protein
LGKLSTQERKRFVYEKLEEQRHLLRKSVKEITAGDLIEALRVSTIIRVLVHDTGSSKALLKQLDQNYLQLEILDVAPPRDEPPPPGTTATVVMNVPITIQVKSGSGTFLSPDLAVENRVPSTLGKWWQRPALILPGAGAFSRKEVVLGLANKEGGTHVDTDITERYQQLIECDFLRVGWGENISPVNISRLMAGQSGLELLWYLDKHFPAVG